MTPDEIAADLEAYVRAVGRIDDGDSDFGRSVHLFDEGYLDSLGTMRLIEYIETTYAIELSADSMLDPEFTTIEGISEIVSTYNPSPAVSTGLSEK